MRQHVEDEALLDGLAHGVEVEGLGLAVGAGRPKTSSVLYLGVAVKAKKLRLGCRPRAAIALMISSW